MPVRAVYFDVGGTILRAHPSVGAVYAEVARDHGIEVTEERLTSSFHSAWKRSLERGRARDHACSDSILRAEWLAIVGETFGDLVGPKRLPALFEDLYERFVSPRAWRLVPGFHETLRSLRAMGLAVGVLSNWDSRLRPLLAELGVLDLLDFTVVSHEVGHEKPHERIFRVALEAARATPREALHVGDSLSADIEPARALGLRTLWVAPAPERACFPDAGPGVESLPEQAAPFWPRLLRGFP